MDEIGLLILLALVIFLGSILGIVAFFQTRRLQRSLDETDAKIQYLINNGFLPETELSPSSKNIAEEQSDQTVAQEAPEDSEFVSKSNADADDSDLIESIPLIEEPAPESITPRRNLEETIGSLWAVWVGGIALALGAIFLVKFSIERGLLSPGVRILLGMAFSLLLIGVGEWSRRRGEAFSFSGFKNANIPAILTAAGTMGAFATIYAAYELYGMLTPLVAFAALGVVAVGTTFAALLHGPLLAALGLLSSLLAPFLVTTDNPSVPGLATYILFVSAAGFAVSRLRFWKWFAVSVATGLFIYGIILNVMSAPTDQLPVAVYIILSWLLVAYIFIVSLYQKSDPALQHHDKTAVVLLTLIGFLILGDSLVHSSNFVSILLLFAIVAGTFLLAHFYSASRAVIYGALVVSFFKYLSWSINLNVLPDLAGVNDVETLLTNFQIREQLSSFTWIGVLLAMTSAGLGLYGALKSTSRAALAIGGAFLPILLFCANYVRIEVFASSFSYAFIALAMFAGFLFLSNYLFNLLEEKLEGRDGASAAYAVAAFVALSLGASIVLEKAALTVTLALLVPAIAFVYHRRPLPALRPLTAIASLLWIARIAWDPSIVGDNLGTTPVFNWLTYGYGVPTIGFAIATWLLSRSGRDKWLEMLEALTLVSFIATLALVALHAIDPAQVFTPIDTLEEGALISIIGGGAALSLLRIRRTTESFVLNHAATLLGYLGMAGAFGGLLILFNPWFTGDSFGDGRILNSLGFAYFVPAIIYFLLSWFAREKRPPIYVKSAAALGALLSSAWVNLTIRHIFHPGGLQWGPTYQSELYTYSIVWLLIAIAILAIGIIWRIKLLRLVSVGILVLVVAKVFLIDMSGLEGILRALSFIGLGATLIGIGLIYQRVLSGSDTEENEKPHENST